MLKTKVYAILGLLLLLAPVVRADDDIDQKALRRAHDFLKTDKRGRHILAYMHFGRTYVDHNYKETRYVTDKEGKRKKGHFALVYTYEWKDDGETEVAFLCDAKGKVYEVKVLDSNAIINQPFAMANATVQLLGNLIIEAFKDNMTAAERKDLQKLVDAADAKGMLELSLKLQQALGK
jgi:hypothetical protein